jgi:hypothetical protein
MSLTWVLGAKTMFFPDMKNAACENSQTALMGIFIDNVNKLAYTGDGKREGVIVWHRPISTSVWMKPSNGNLTACAAI